MSRWDLAWEPRQVKCKRKNKSILGMSAGSSIACRPNFWKKVMGLPLYFHDDHLFICQANPIRIAARLCTKQTVVISNTGSGGNNSDFIHWLLCVWERGVGLNIDGVAKTTNGVVLDWQSTEVIIKRACQLTCTNLSCWNSNSGQAGPSMGEDLNSLKTHFLFCSVS